MLTLNEIQWSTVVASGSVLVSFGHPKPSKITLKDTQIFFVKFFFKYQFQAYNDITEFFPSLSSPVDFVQILCSVSYELRLGWYSPLIARYKLYHTPKQLITNNVCNLIMLWYPLKNRMPKSHTIANFGHPISKSWLRPSSGVLVEFWVGLVDFESLQPYKAAIL